MGAAVDVEGLLFGGTWEGPWLWDGEHGRAMETWHAVQDDVFG